MRNGYLSPRNWAKALVLAGVLCMTLPSKAAEDYRDQIYLRDVIIGRLETQRVGSEEVWMNTATGNRGTIVIDREGSIGINRSCRDYRKIIDQPDGAPIIYTGRGCQDESGVWRVQPEIAAVPPSVPGRPSDPAPPTARADREPEPPPFQAPPPPRKPDPSIFYASTPVPSVY